MAAALRRTRMRWISSGMKVPTIEIGNLVPP